MKTKIFVITLAVTAGSAHADTPIQLSLIPDMALYPRTEEVRGVALSIWGENPQKALAIGLVNGSTGDSGGLSIGPVNYAESYTGVQWGAVNISTENFMGWQNGWINISQGTFTGFQLGLVNIGEDVTGLQAGWVNYAQDLHGVQIGFVNIAMNNPVFTELPNKLSPVFPVLNWSF